MLKKIVFRVDSSSQIGSGHLMRCLTLANRVKGKAEIIFICRDLSGNLSKLVVENGFRVILLPHILDGSLLTGYEQWLGVPWQIDAEQTLQALKESIDCLIVDHYALDYKWEQELRPYARQIMVIDDLANRRHDCDILLDQNYVMDFKIRYDNLVDAKCRKFLGPRYVLLREEFYEAKKNLRVRDGKIKNVLVFFGGSDNINATGKTLGALASLSGRDFEVKVVVGENSPYNDEIKNICNQNENMHFHCQIDYMAKLMIDADLAIGAGGSTTLERCFLQVPSLIISVAENQIDGNKDLAQRGCINYLGKSEDVDKEILTYTLCHYLAFPDKLREMSASCEGLFNGYDGAKLNLQRAILN